MPQKTSQSGWWQRVSYPQFWDVDILYVGIILLVLISEMLTEKEDEASGLN
jgi:rhamnogalacturonyl hydrolase YesR